MTQPFRIAFVGVDHPHGSGWRDLLTHIPDASLTAIVPYFDNRTCSLEERYSALPRFQDVDALLQQGSHLFDGAIVCLPNCDSPTVASKLARAGKHILLEKPGAESENHFAPIAEAVSSTSVSFQSGFLWRYDPGVERLRAMVADRRFGKIISIEAGLFTSDVNRRGPSHYLFDSAQTGPRGFFHWLMCHWLDLVLYIFQEPVIAVMARVGRFGATPIEMDDGGTAILELASGAIVTLIGGYWLPRWAGESHWTIRGSERWIHWNPNKPGTGGEFVIHGPQPQFLGMNETFLLPEDKTHGYGGARGVELIREWIDASRGVVPNCRNTVNSVRSVLALIDLIYQSSDAGRRLPCNVSSSGLS